MFKKIPIANRGAHAAGVVAPATNRMQAGAAGQAGELTPEAAHV